MKVFTVDDFLHLPEEAQASVSEWLREHEIDNAFMLISEEVKHQSPLDASDFVTSNVLAVYEQVMNRTRQQGEDRETVEYYEGFPTTLVRSLQLNYDDFPWDIIKAGDTK